MTRAEWIDSMKDQDEVVFRITRGCDRCAAYLPVEDGRYECEDPKDEAICRREHSMWLSEMMDF